MISWKKRNWKKQIISRSKMPIYGELDKLVSKHKVTWFWVKAHNGHVENELSIRWRICIDELLRIKIMRQIILDTETTA